MFIFHSYVNALSENLGACRVAGTVRGWLCGASCPVLLGCCVSSLLEGQVQPPEGVTLKGHSRDEEGHSRDRL